MIHIFLAAYNGEKYIEDQLISILNQTETDWRLHICDDCSTDTTREIISRFVLRYPDRIFSLENDTNLGACATFSRLMQEVREPGYYVFCDQDDVWKPNKLAIMQQELKIREQQKKEPILLYSDVVVIDRRGRVKANSFIRQSGLYFPGKKLLEHLFCYNFVQGASMMWNYELHKLVDHIPPQALMHDWWLALAAAGNGKIFYVDKVLGAYRQHSDNVVGAFDRKKWRRSVRKKAGISNWNRLRQNNRVLQRERILQAEAYKDCFGDERANRFIQIMNDKNRIRRAVRGIRGGYIFLSAKYSLKFYIL